MMLLMEIPSFDLLSKCIQSFYLFLVTELIVSGCPSLIAWPFAFLILFIKYQPRGIMKEA